MLSSRAHPGSAHDDDRDRFGPPAAVRDLVARHPATVRGHLRHVRTLAGANGPTFEAELCDATGAVVLVFFGRRTIPGLVPGVAIEARGTPRANGCRTEILNPLYELLAPLGDAEPNRQARDTRSEP
ncbi:MAG: OB-fold nucleic acid binding domain-containing protein [Acidimicrobiales bacterium]|jgi:hypothetical protein